MIHSAVCFADILGFSQMVLDAHEVGTGNELLQRLHSILSMQYKKLKLISDYVGVMKSFTDNIIIGLPIFDDGESQLGGIFLNFAQYQLALTLDGFFIRGGVAIGDFYGDDDFTYGPAIIEAHKLEKVAIYPRIILGDEVVELVKQHINYYAEPEYSPQNFELLKDNTDGKWFINYLDAVMENVSENGDYEEAIKLLQQHKQEIEKNLNKFSTNQYVLNKYVWSAQYHNYFCSSNLPKQFDLIISGYNNGNFSRIV